MTIMNHDNEPSENVASVQNENEREEGKNVWPVWFPHSSVCDAQSERAPKPFPVKIKINFRNVVSKIS